MIFYWLLVTHACALFPLVVNILDFLYNNSKEALYIAIKLIVTTIVSIVYHSYNYDNLTFDTENHKTNWQHLDYIFANSMIIAFYLYFLKIKNHSLYIVSSISFYLILTLYNYVEMKISILCILISILSISLYKGRIIIAYANKFPFYFFCFFFFSCGALASFINSEKNYKLYHSLWHISIFCTAGFGSYIKYKHDENELMDFIYTRTRTESESI